MKSIFILLFLLVFISGSILAQSSTKSRVIKPTNFKKRVSHLISEKTRNYYSLSKEKPSIISLQGPGTLRVITRGRFVPIEENTIKYAILYTIDGGKQMKVKKTSVERAPKATYVNNELGVPGQLEDFEIVLGRGNHSIESYLRWRTRATAPHVTPPKEPPAVRLRSSRITPMTTWALRATPRARFSICQAN